MQNLSFSKGLLLILVQWLNVEEPVIVEEVLCTYAKVGGGSERHICFGNKHSNNLVSFQALVPNIKCQQDI